VLKHNQKLKNEMFWRNTWPAFAWAVIILILCGIPGDDLPELSFLEWLRPDKIVHLLLFGMQSYLLIRGFERQKHFSLLQRNAVFISITITILFGCVVEILQTFLFIHRSGDVRDAIANAIGAFAGWWIYKKYFRSKTIYR
jgi:glycopeptide antibiotics resistance protein